MRTIAIHNGVADRKLLDEQQPDIFLADLSLLFSCLTGLQSIAITGRITEGLKESGFFTQRHWVREQFINKLGIDPYPGTLNLDVVGNEDLVRIKEVKKLKGIEIIPAEPGFCPAKCFHVLVAGKVKGALVIPIVPDYPESKLEIISSDRIRDVLSLKVGDFVQLEIL